MAWVQPQLVLSVLGVFLLGYGVSLVVRTRAAARWRRQPTKCPECRREWGAGAPRCSACGYEAIDATRGRARWWRFGGGLFSAAGLGALVTAVVLVDWWVGDTELSWEDDRSFSVGPALGAGLALSIVGVWVAAVGYRGQKARGRRRCPRCWYLIDAAVGLRCSECGHEARRERDLFRPRRRWRIVAMGALLIALAQLGWLESRVRRGGPVAAVPTEVLILGMPWLPEEWVLGESAYFAPVSDEYDEDWSLAGRLYSYDDTEDWEAHAWRWHEDLAAWRAGGLITPHASPQVILRALRLRSDPAESWVGDGEDPRLLTPDEGRVILGIIIGSMDSPDPQTIEATERLWDQHGFGALPGDFTVVAELEPHAARIVEIAADHEHPLRTMAVTLAGYLADRPGLVQALENALHDGDRHAIASLVAQAERSPQAREAAVEMLESDAHGRMAAMMVSIMGPQDPVFRETLWKLLRSDDPQDQVTGATAIWRYEPPGGEAEAWIAGLIRGRPGHAESLTRSLRRFDGALTRQADLFFELSGSDQDQHRDAAVYALTILVFDAPEPTDLARRANERLAEIARSDPDADRREIAGWGVKQEWRSDDAETP